MLDEEEEDEEDEPELHFVPSKCGTLPPMLNS
jgi:hypothetical protein